MELEISAWLENVSFQLTEIGKELVEEVGTTVNQLLMEARGKGMDSEGFVQDLDLKFIPRIPQRSDIGFLCHGSLLPSSFTMELVTRIADITVGANITFTVEAEGLISPFVKNNLDFSVLTEKDESVTCQEVAYSAGGGCLMFSFTIPCDGQYLVKATLYEQNIVGSPVIIPVSGSPASGLAQLGLATLCQNTSHVAPDEGGISSTHLGRKRSKDEQVGTISLPLKVNVASLHDDPGALPTEGFVRDVEQQKKFVMGDFCLAKWDQDGVWYKAKIDKDCRERGVEVTFVDYDNSDFVQRENIVWSKEELPGDAEVDPGPFVFGVGDDVVAQWDEDGVWYNARVLKQEEGGYSVIFTDYENVAFVEATQILKEVIDISKREVLDIHLQLLLEDMEQGKVTSEGKINKMVSKWTVGNDCLARWVEDGRWYNAIVDTVFESSSSEPVQFLVTFTDYGNSGIVTDDDMAANVGDLPGDQLNMLDENVQRSDLPSSSVNEHKTRKPIVRTNLDIPPTPLMRCDVLMKGSEIIAKREEDQTWHRAVIHEVVAAGRLYIVRYEDIGQYGGAGPENIVMGREDIPQGEEVGQDVTEEVRRKIVEKAVWSVGDSCIARWSEDNVWYNARVLSVVAEGSFILKFVDYGNEENVVEQDMVKTAMEIPADSFVDENVDHTAEEEPKVKSEVIVHKSYEEITEHKSVPKAPRPLKAESFDQARLLATAVSVAAGSRKGCEQVCSVPALLQCCLCQNICRKGMRVACDSSPVCWGCAVKEITRGHVCWLCGEKNITSDSHLVKDQVMRSFVEQFITTGKLDPAHEQALRNGMKRTQVESGVEPRSVEQSAPSVKLEPVVVLENDACLAKSSEDGIWYNGIVTDVYGDGSSLVYFMDYGNAERVEAGHIVKAAECIPNGDRVDPNVQQVTSRKIAPTLKSTSSEQLNFLSLTTPGEDGSLTLTAKETLSIKDLKGPIGVTVLADSSLAVVCRGANSVSRYDKEGAFLGIVRPGREFVKPSDILTLSSGEFVVRDDRGIQLFSVNLEFVKFVAEDWIDRCFGLAEDDEGRIITINCNSNTVDESRVKITLSNNTDVFFIDKISNKVVKRIEMVDLIEDAVVELQNLQAEMSACRFLSYHNKKLYVVDLGLDCVFILTKDGTESELFGSRGNKGGEFRDPAGLVVDDIGTMMVVDSRNHRLQLIDSDLNFAGVVKVKFLEHILITIEIFSLG